MQRRRILSYLRYFEHAANIEYNVTLLMLSNDFHFLLAGTNEFQTAKPKGQVMRFDNVPADTFRYSHGEISQYSSDASGHSLCATIHLSSTVLNGEKESRSQNYNQFLVCFTEFIIFYTISDFTVANCSFPSSLGDTIRLHARGRLFSTVEGVTCGYGQFAQ